MAQKQTTSKTGSKPAAKKKSPAVPEPQPPRFRREIWAAVFLLLSGLLFISFFNMDGAFVAFFANLVKGFVGWGVWAAAPAYLFISLILFSLLRIDNILLSIIIRLLIIFGVAAVLNEPFSALEVAEINWATRILRAPIDLFQHMTTAEPHPQMLELTVCAFKAALGELEETAE